MNEGLYIVIEDYSGDNYHRVGHVIGEYQEDYIIQLHSNDARIIRVNKKCAREIIIKEETNEN